jgi:hypothetical protein
MTEVQHREDRTAIVPHDCDCCGAEIQIGQVYTRVFFTVENAPSILKYHKPRAEGDECGKTRRKP